MNLLKEFSRGDMQNDLKTSDGSTAGSTDTAMKKVDVGFSLMRNMINTDGQVSGSDVNDYLERAQDLNDEVESVGFAIETDDGDIIKIYVNAQEADGFEEEMSKLLGLEGDIEEAINQLAQKFDIVDVVWPRDPEGEGEQDPDAELSIEDGDVFAGTEPEAPAGDADGSVLPADDDALPGDEPPTDALPGEGDADEAPADGEAPAADGEAPADDDEFEDIPRADAAASDEPPADDEAPADDAAAAAPADDEAPSDDEAPAEDDEAEMEPVLNDDGTQKLDKDGNPVMRKKKKEKAKEPSLDDLPSGEAPIKTEEGLSRLSRIAEAARDELAAHAEAQLALGDKGKYMIMATISGDTHGLRTRPLKRAGEVAYFESAEEAQAEATRLTREKNRAGATASYRYVPKLVEDKQPQPKESNTMTIGSKFLSRVTEAKSVEDQDAVKDGMNIPLDTQQRQLVANLKRPLEKKLIAFFAMAGIIGRLLKNEPDLEDRVRGAADMLRKNASARNAFTAFYNALATARGFGMATEALVAERGEHSAERKRGASVQQKFEAVMVALGLPEGLITTTGPGPIASYVAKTAKLIDASGDLQTLLNTLANRLGVRGAEAPEDREAKAAKKPAPGAKFESLGSSFLARMDEVEVKSMDPFAKDVIELLRALGVPSEHLSYKPQVLKAALEAKGKSLKNRSTVDQYVERLAAMVAGNVKPEAKPAAAPARTMGKGPAMATESLLAEAFGELEALTRSDLEHFNMAEPSAGPAMMAAYNGADSHAETVLAVGIDPEATGRLTLRVGIDGPWDGSMHHRYFPDDEEGYKSALKYANMMRTVNLKTGGRPKGWK